MSDAPEDPIVLSVRLLRQAGLRDFADVLYEQPIILAQRLEAACRSLSLAPETFGDQWRNDLIALASRKGSGEITTAAFLLEESEEATKSGFPVEPPAPEDFEPWGWNNGLPDVNLPGEGSYDLGLAGEEDSESRRRKKDKDL